RSRTRSRAPIRSDDQSRCDPCRCRRGAGAGRTMQLAALTAGIGAGADAFSGVVHSVFARACNIVPASGMLLALSVREAGAVPHGFQLAPPAGFPFLDHVRRGQTAACRGGVLRIAGSALSVDLRPARAWRSALSRLDLDLRRRDVASAWETAWSGLIGDRGRN